jgi:8-oxo-dGTP pyrophosphatase MutT (NUDIX family)
MLGWAKDFDHFSNELASAMAKGLPGMDAQYSLVPPNRPRPDLALVKKEKNPRLAGVLALFYPIENTPHLVLMKRNTYPGVHSGQISLPGGQHEAHDASIIATALRETHEEIGVETRHIEVIGQLTELYIPPSNFLVQPVVGLAKFRPSFVPEAKEVHRLLEIPFAEFAKPENLKETTVSARGFTINVPAFSVDGEVVWGATAMILSELLALLKQPA